MRFGIQHAVGDPGWSPAVLEPAAMRRFARAAEDGGFDAIAFTDHPAPPAAWVDNGGEGVADMFGALGFCAAITDRIRLLTFVLVPSYRNPFLAAHQLATLDALSAGRLTIGLGTGYLFGEMRALGGDPGRRREDFDERVALLLQAWTGEEVSHEGAGFTAKRTRVHPPIVQQPHPPFWIHGNSPFGVERAARIGDGWMGMLTGANDLLVKTVRTVPLPDLDALARRIDDVRVATAAAGRDVAEVEIIATGAWPMLDVRTGGSTQQLIDQVAALEQLGVDWVVCTVVGDDVGAAVDTVAWFAAEVINA